MEKVGYMAVRRHPFRSEMKKNLTGLDKILYCMLIIFYDEGNKREKRYENAASYTNKLHLAWLQ